MRIYTVFILLVLFGQAHGLFGIGSFFRSARTSVERISGVVEEQGRALRAVVEQKIVPDFQQTMKELRLSAAEIVNMTKRLEERLEQSLDRLDEIVKSIGQNVNHVVDIVIVLACIAVFCVCSHINSSSRDEHVKYEFLTLLMFISLITATGVILRVFYVSVLKLELLTTAATLKYCVIYPVGIVVLWKILRLVYYALCQLGTVVYFFILGPRLILFITIDGPMLWVWRAYKYAPEMKSRKAMFVTVSLPWLMTVVILLVYNLIVTLDSDKDQFAFVTSMLAGYLYFYCSSIYVYLYLQRPPPQERLRALYGGNTAMNKNCVKK